MSDRSGGGEIANDRREVALRPNLRRRVLVQPGTPIGDFHGRAANLGVYQTTSTNRSSEPAVTEVPSFDDTSTLASGRLRASSDRRCRRSPRTTSERANRLRADSCFALAERSSQELVPAQLGFVPCERLAADERNARSRRGADATACALARCSSRSARRVLAPPAELDTSGSGVIRDSNRATMFRRGTGSL